jgi:hypothetical protein
MREPKQYDQGQVVRVLAHFKNPATGVFINPATVKFKIKDPTGTASEYEFNVGLEITQESTGKFYVDINADKPGFWYYRFWSEGSGIAAYQGVFRVRTSNVL